jgi:hypothetical protein
VIKVRKQNENHIIKSIHLDISKLVCIYSFCLNNYTNKKEEKTSKSTKIHAVFFLYSCIGAFSSFVVRIMRSFFFLFDFMSYSSHLLFCYVKMWCLDGWFVNWKDCLEIVFMICCFYLYSRLEEFHFMYFVDFIHFYEMLLP